jgi:hypothetical protein
MFGLAPRQSLLSRTVRNALIRSLQACNPPFPRVWAAPCIASARAARVQPGYRGLVGSDIVSGYRVSGK